MSPLAGHVQLEVTLSKPRPIFIFPIFVMFLVVDALFLILPALSIHMSQPPSNLTTS